MKEPPTAVAWLGEQPSYPLRVRTSQWLLDRAQAGQDAREWRASRDLVGLWRSQAGDGSWHGPALYVPKHRATFWVLGVLAEMGAGRWLPEVEKAAEFAFRFQAGNGEFYQSRQARGGRPSSSAPVPCVTARLLGWLAELGYVDDPRLELGIDYLLSIQRDDGGWSCAGRAMPRGSHTAKPCLGVTESFLALAEAVPRLRRHPAVGAAARLVSELYFRSPRGYHVADTWQSLKYPVWGLDVAATGRRLLGLLGPAARPAVRPGIEYVLARRRPDGLWCTDGHDYRPPIPAGRRAKPHPWVTLRVLRFLKAAARTTEDAH